MSQKKYIHGYTETERQRLLDQGEFLKEMIYSGIDFSACHHVLEVGCGVGAHIKMLLQLYPNLTITGVDIDATQIEQAEQNLQNAGFKGRYKLMVADATNLILDPSNLPDGAFFCWVLEHLNNAIELLTAVRKQLQPGSPIYITEVYNNGFFIQPELPNLQQYWKAYNILQANAGGDTTAGVKLGYYLTAAGYQSIQLKPISQFHDLRNPKLRAEMANYLYNLLMSGKEELLNAQLVTPEIIAALPAEFEQLCQREDAIIFYPGFQAFGVSR
jgi:ubiquinone/menaquinone biosynthesis C-methylase UbiE